MATQSDWSPEATSSNFSNEFTVDMNGHQPEMYGTNKEFVSGNESPSQYVPSKDEFKFMTTAPMSPTGTGEFITF